MPIPKRNQKEDQQKFVSRCMSNETMKKEYPDSKQRVAICLGQTKQKSKGNIFEQTFEILNYYLSLGYCDNCIGYEEDLTIDNLVIPKDSDYIDCDEETEEYACDTLASYRYKDPKTGEIFYYDMRMNHTKDGRTLVYVGKAEEYQGRKVTLNKPFRTPGGPKKFSVYVKNEKGNVVKVNFGDPERSIKRDSPERRKNFRARHGCDNPSPKYKAKYWSCKFWSNKKVSDLT